MKKIKEPNPQVIKFESMDVIATSGDAPLEYASAKGESMSKGYKIVFQ